MHETVRSKVLLSSATSTIVAMVALGTWLAIAIFTETRHEFYRDEVRALSLAREARSPLHLYELTQYDGHPILWFFMLYVGDSMIDSPIILPVMGILIGFSAVAFFMFFSPFPLWARCLFIFSALPLYEYSVVARNYGISMLLLFFAAALYRYRMKHPWPLAFVLALLANTNVHSAVLTCLVSAVWFWDTISAQLKGTVPRQGLFHYAPFVLVFAGGLLCAICTQPRENSILTTAHQSMSVSEFANSLAGAVFRPNVTFSEIMPQELPSVVAITVLYVAIFGLAQQPNLFLAAFVGQIAFGLLFSLVYAGEYRHQGLFLIFMVFLYWLFMELKDKQATTRAQPLLFRLGFCALLILIVGDVVKTKDTVLADISYERSSSRAFGEFLNGSEIYRDAIIVPEPDYLIEALPYYSKNRIYLPREHRFGTSVSWTTDADCRLSLGELISVSRELKTRHEKPVLIVIGHWDLDQQLSGEIEYSYNKIFSWNVEDFENLNESLVLVQEFNSAGTDENFRVYAFK